MLTWDGEAGLLVVASSFAKVESAREPQRKDIARARGLRAAA